MTHLSDIEIARKNSMVKIDEISSKIGIGDKSLNRFGHNIAKIDINSIDGLDKKPDGNLILVTAISPTPAGEGKTTTSVGLSDALNLIGKKSIVCLREPSLGPCFGVKGGAAGGGYAQVVPMEKINLHFTGDFHAITSAHNLLASLLDNHIYWGNELGIDIRRIAWGRVVDLNDRALRATNINLGGVANGFPREDKFDITVASEVMAIFCLATSLKDLQKKIGNIIVGYTRDRKEIYAKDLNADGAMTTLLKDAFMPNLVQTLEKNPAFIHGGPFANIAHGCNSLVATQTALKLSDFVVTEAGFGADLGAEKFLDIKCQSAGLSPKAVVITTTIRALKYHGGANLKSLTDENVSALKKGIPNLEKHIENIQQFNLVPIISINRFVSDTDSEIEEILRFAKEKNIRVSVAEVWAKGGEGALDLAKQVVEVVESGESNFKQLYNWDMSVRDKIKTIATKVYGAVQVDYSVKAKKNLKTIADLGMENLPICMAKTQKSLSDDPKVIGRPEGFTITIREIEIAAGAGFLIPITGDMMRMPGLPAHPASENISIDNNGIISGLF